MGPAVPRHTTAPRRVVRDLDPDLAPEQPSGPCHERQWNRLVLAEDAADTVGEQARVEVRAIAVGGEPDQVRSVSHDHV